MALGAGLDDRLAESSEDVGLPSSGAPGSPAGAMPRLARTPDTPRMPQPQVPSDASSP